MDSTLYDMIFRRKSFHLFRHVGDALITDTEIEEIIRAYNSFSALYPEIRTAIRVVPGEETSCRRGEQYCILFYSEVKDGYLQNIGYLGEQLDLYLVSRDIGTLWFGIGRPEEEQYEGLSFVIMIAIRKIGAPNKFRKDMFKSKRKPVADIWKGDAVIGVTEIVRFSPSACNSQPWIVRNNGGEISVYRYRKPGKRGIMPANKVSFYNQIDIGIFLCFMDLCLAHSGIEYERELVRDGDDDVEMLNAVYRLTGTNSC